jgi:hypothetical protein
LPVSADFSGWRRAAVSSCFCTWSSLLGTHRTGTRSFCRCWLYRAHWAGWGTPSARRFPPGRRGCGHGGLCCSYGTGRCWLRCIRCSGIPARSWRGFRAGSAPSLGRRFYEYPQVDSNTTPGVGDPHCWVGVLARVSDGIARVIPSAPAVLRLLRGAFRCSGADPLVPSKRPFGGLTTTTNGTSGGGRG